jgi:hypothetical protein
MRPALRALLLAALVATAGCSGVFGGEPGASETITTEGGPLAPGLTEDGIADANVLVNAHGSSLDGESLTMQERHVQRYGNGTLRWQENRTILAASNRTRYLMVTDVTGKPMFGDSESRAEIFADGDRVYRSVRTPNGSWADVLRTASGDPGSPSEVPVDPARTDDAYVLLSAFDANGSEYVRERTPDARRYLVETSALEHPGLLASHLELDAVRNATLEVIVTSDGRIEEYRVEYEGTHDGAVVRGERTLWYSAVGETTVEAPAWLDEVEDRNGTSEGAAEGTSEGKLLRPRESSPRD